MGNQSKDALEDLYSLSDIGVIPSLEEQCSYVALEMMQAGLPVLISKIPGVGELIPDEMHINQLPISFKSTEIAIDVPASIERIKQLLHNKAYQKSYKLSLKKLLKTKFDVRQMCEMTLATYHNVLKNQNFVPMISSETPISIVIPCFNAEKTIKHAVQSVLSQEGVDDIEIIIIDDCSTDSTVTQIESIYDSRIRLIKNDKHYGLVKSLNEGIKLSTREYIARLDADDIMLPNRLVKQASFLDNNPDYVIVGSNMFVSDADMNIISCICYPEKDVEIKFSQYLTNPFGHPSVMLRRDIFNTFKFEESYTHCEDYYLWYKLLKQFKAYNLQEFLTIYRMRKSSISVSKAEIQHRNTIDLLIDEYEALFRRTLTLSESKVLGTFNIGAPPSYWKKHDTESRNLIHDLLSHTVSVMANQNEFTNLIMECARRQLL